MKLSVFLFVSFCVVLFLFVWRAIRRNEWRSNNYGSRVAVVALFMLLATIGVRTVNKYLYPKDRDVYSNADYHILRHKGFRFDNQLKLVSDSEYAEPDNTVLWDSKVGDILLSCDQIEVMDFPEPFYYTYNSASSQYKLYNRPFKGEYTDGFTLTNEQDSVIFKLTITPNADKKYLTDYCFKLPNGELFKSNFKLTIKKGYPISDIIAQTPGLRLPDSISLALAGTYLLRDKIYADQNKLVDNSILTLFPGVNLIATEGLKFSGECCDMTPNKDSLKVEDKPVYFFSGLGSKRSSVMQLRKGNKSGSMELLYALPKMQKLRDSLNNRVFITSSVAGVLENADMGGYYFNIFDNEQNFNHISGQLRYKSGNAREPMSFEVFDYYSNNPTSKRQVVAGEEFELCTKGQTSLKWLFDVEDLRATNQMQWWNIVIYIFIFTLLVSIRILEDSRQDEPTLTFFELCAYVVVLAFMVVRLILAWRASTFVPIEGITGAVYNAMRESIIDWDLRDMANIKTYIPMLFPLYMLLRGKLSRLTYWLDEQDWLWRLKEWGAAKIDQLSSHIPSWARNAADWVAQSLPESIKERFSEGKGRAMVLYVCLLGLFAVLSKLSSSLERVANIPLPLICYLLFDRWLTKQENSTTARVLLALTALCYIILADAGFAIVLLIYYLLFTLFVEPMFGEKGKLAKWALGLAGLLGTFLILRFEGEMMIWVFENVKYIVLPAVLALGVLSIVGALWYSGQLSRRAIGINAAVLVLLAVSVWFLGADTIVEQVNKKEHMKYRAEIQKLDEGERIDKLMKSCKFDSSDITYIMRSAHNQWFINQYIKAGEQAEDSGRYFTIQPHSNQGSPYNTQTTDLVVTRYILAEHNESVVFWLLALLLMLVISYFAEASLKKAEGRVFFGGLLLLFVLALLVYLSATNRIVFIGQDFPMISIQSLVTVLLPITLIALATINISADVLSDGDTEQAERSDKWIFSVALIVWAAMAVWFIPQEGSDLEDNQFDVSEIYADLTEKIKPLERMLRKFQNDVEGVQYLPKDEFWSAFKSSPQGKPYYEQGTALMVADSASFSRSLLDYFENPQSCDKNNPENLLHIKRRNGRWTVALNKKHYFIPSMIDKANQWKGNLYAANVGCDYIIQSANSEKRLYGYSATKPARQQHISQSFRKLDDVANKSGLFNISLIDFDPEWSRSNEPIILLASQSGRDTDSRQSYSVETPEESITNNYNNSTASMRLHKGDYVVLTQGDKEEPKEVHTWRYMRETERLLARNVWINGRQKLFYPLGKESMWSYQFANMVNNVFSKSDTTRNIDLKTSLDYDLHKSFYSHLEKTNHLALSIPKSLSEELVEFSRESEKQMVSRTNKSKFWYDKENKKVVYKGNQEKRFANELTKVLNLNLEKLPKNYQSLESRISTAVAQTLERNYNFSAVAIDGNGRIRLLFDHNKHRNVDPNNTRHINELISALYKEGSVSEENEVFGNRAVLSMESGPGSTFKPIAYTAVTSQKKLNWSSFVIKSPRHLLRRELTAKEIAKGKGLNDAPMRVYGGVRCKEADCGGLNIAGRSDGVASTSYLVHSNNVMHSLVIMLGLQNDADVKPLMRELTAAEKQRVQRDSMLHPVFSYNEKLMRLDRDVWFGKSGEKFNPHRDNAIIKNGLNENFCIESNYKPGYQNMYGTEPLFELLYKQGGNQKCWTYPGHGAMGVGDMGRAPILINGFNQLALGAYPLELSPLEMGQSAMRLATLNAAENLTTLSDDATQVPEYKPFSTPEWGDEQKYFEFYRSHILPQLKKVPIEGTAKGVLDGLTKVQREKYHIYAKTGTLDVESDDNERMKHLLVIIANKPLELARSVEELREIKYYALYLSFMNIDLSLWKDGGNRRFAPLIKMVVESETFQNYMNQ